MEIIKKDDRWTIPVDGRKIIQCNISYQLGLIFWESSKWDLSIQIEGKFIYLRNKETLQLDIEEGPNTLCPIISVVHQPVDTIIAYKDGRLEINFSNGDQILVPIDPQYEAWNLAGTNGLMFVSMPGGGLAEWLPKPSDDIMKSVNK